MLDANRSEHLKVKIGTISLVFGLCETVDGKTKENNWPLFDVLLPMITAWKHYSNLLKKTIDTASDQTAKYFDVALMKSLADALDCDSEQVN